MTLRIHAVGQRKFCVCVVLAIFPLPVEWFWIIVDYALLSPKPGPGSLKRTPSSACAHLVIPYRLIPCRRMSSAQFPPVAASSAPICTEWNATYGHAFHVSISVFSGRAGIDCCSGSGSGSTPTATVYMYLYVASDECTRVFVYLGIIIMCYSGGNGKWQKVVRLRRKKNIHTHTHSCTYIPNIPLDTWYSVLAGVRYCQMLLVGFCCVFFSGRRRRRWECSLKTYLHRGAIEN